MDASSMGCIFQKFLLDSTYFFQNVVTFSETTNSIHITTNEYEFELKIPANSWDLKDLTLIIHSLMTYKSKRFMLENAPKYEMSTLKL